MALELISQLQTVSREAGFFYLELRIPFCDVENRAFQQYGQVGFYVMWNQQKIDKYTVSTSPNATSLRCSSFE